jgi:hypothetical protein
MSSVAQQISKLISLNARGLLDDESLAFAIHELQTNSREEKKAVAPPTHPPPSSLASPPALVTKVKKARPKIETSYEKRRRRKAEHEEKKRTEGFELLASLSESDMVGLTKALTELAWGRELGEMEEYVHEKGPKVFVDTGYWHAEFNVQIKEKERLAGGYTIRAWAEDLPREFIAEMQDMYERKDAFMLEEANLYVAIRWGWASWFFNRTSAGGYVEVVKFGPCPRHETGAWNIENQKLKSRGIIQPSIGAPGGKFVMGGSEISRPQFYREDSCMLNLFLDWGNNRLKAHKEQLNHKALFKLATGKDLEEGMPGDVTLREAEKWLELWRVAGRAIDHAGQLVWSFEPISRNKKIVGGSVWRLMVHNQHVWLCDVATKEFDQHFGGSETVPVAGRSHEVSPDISKTLSGKWPRAPEPTGDLVEIVTDVGSVLALPEASMTNGEPQDLAIALWEAGYEPGSLTLAMGVIESFTVRLGERAVRIRRAVDVEMRDDQVPFAAALKTWAGCS